MPGKKRPKTIPKLQKRADETAVSINNGLERDIRNNTDYDNRDSEANKEADDAAKKI